jgi:hypothetical protein
LFIIIFWIESLIYLTNQHKETREISLGCTWQNAI